MRNRFAGFDLRTYLFEHYQVYKVESLEHQFHMNCPFCDDKKAKFYIQTKDHLFWCHKCQEKPDVVDFVATTENISKKQALHRVKTESQGVVEYDPAKLKETLDKVGKLEVTETKIESIAYPEYYVPLYTGYKSESILPYVTYLYKRGLTDQTIAAYKLGCCLAGKFAKRVILPTFFKGQLVGYQARDITGIQEPKTLNPAGFNKSKYLFNYDSVVDGEEVIVVEGPFGAMHLGPKAVASFGKSLSDAQRGLLEPFSKITLLLDADAKDWALKQAHSFHNANVYVVLLPKGQPDDYSAAELQKFLNEALLISGGAAFKEELLLKLNTVRKSVDLNMLGDL